MVVFIKTLLPLLLLLLLFPLTTNDQMSHHVVGWQCRMAASFRLVKGEASSDVPPLILLYSIA